MKLLPLLFCGIFAARAVSATNPDAATAAINELGLDLHRQLASKNPNLCLSPLSIQSALVMTFAGAEGQTREQMAKALHYPASDSALNDSFAALREELDAVRKRSAAIATRSKQTGGPSEPIALNLANRLFGEKEYAFRTPFLDLLKDHFQAPLEPLDFRKNADGSRQRINAWIEEETKGRIKDLIPQGALSATTRLVLANALYFKAPWATEFSEHATKPEPFHIAGTKAEDVPTMINKIKIGYAKLDGFTALALPYSGGDLQFLILLPDKPDGLVELESHVTAAELAKGTKLEFQEILLHLPKFKLTSPSLSLKESLTALGMKSAFDQPAGSANFDKVAPRQGNEYLYIDDVFHKTFISVDEHGTEAAAATAVAIAGRAFVRPAEPIEVRVDHPFLYAIQDRASGACLFLGRLSDPR